MRVLITAALALLAACSASSSSTDGGVADAACASVTPGAQVPIVVDAGSAQGWAGGTIAAGTYALTAYTFYGDGCALPPSGSDAVTIEFTPSAAGATSGTVQTAFDQLSATGVHTTGGQAGTYSTSGSTLQINETCPSIYTAPSYLYTASANALEVWTLDAGTCGAYLEVFAKQ